MFKLKIIFPLFILPLFGLYATSPITPSKLYGDESGKQAAPLSPSIAYVEDWTFDRKMRVNNWQNFDHFRMDTRHARLKWTLHERIYLYGSMGRSKIFASTPSPISIQLDFYTDEGISWAVGSDVLTISWSPLSMGWSGKYFHSEPTISYLTDDGMRNENTTGAKILFDEWQIGFTCTYQAFPITPYLGGKFSYAHCKIDPLPHTFTLKTKLHGKNRHKFWTQNWCYTDK